MIKFKKGKYNIATRKGPEEVEGWVIQPKQNLGIHRALTYKNYTVDCLPQGHRILGNIDSLKEAKEFCEEIVDIADWSNLTPFKIPEDISNKVK